MEREKLINFAEKQLVYDFYSNIERLNKAGMDYKAIAKGLGRSLVTLTKWKQQGAFNKNGVTVKVATELNQKMRNMVKYAEKIGILDNI